MATLEDRTGMSDQCTSCHWYIGPIAVSATAKYFHRRNNDIACRAYPRGIPNEILEGRIDHHSPYPGDNGLRWRDNSEFTEEQAVSGD